MDRRDVMVGYVSRVEHPSAERKMEAEVPTAVRFADGRTAKLDPRDPRSKPYAALLENLARDGVPVYVEIDAATEHISALHIALRVTVTDLAREGSGDVDVTLRPSHARHVLRAKDPHFGALIAALENAREQRAVVLVTETDNHEIIDVRPAPERPPYERTLRREPEFEGEREFEPERERDDDREIELEREREDEDEDEDEPRRHRLERCVSFARAEALFDLCENTTCDPNAVPPPCIPFLYPDNGCWVRAHEMCRLIRGAGVEPAKVWIDGTLNVPSRNKPDCLVQWNWHVAPTVCVEDDEQEYLVVIDPSLFDLPVTEATWKGLQGDPQATLTQTAWTVYYRPNDTDPNFTTTVAELANFRALLQTRSIQQGPPPYANCP